MPTKSSPGSVMPGGASSSSLRSRAEAGAATSSSANIVATGRKRFIHGRTPCGDDLFPAGPLDDREAGAAGVRPVAGGVDGGRAQVVGPDLELLARLRGVRARPAGQPDRARGDAPGALLGPAVLARRLDA